MHVSTASRRIGPTVFFDPNLLTVGDMEHSENEPRWFSIGIAGNGVLLSVVYLWSDADPFAIKMRLISARRATSAECRQYDGELMNPVDDNDIPDEIDFSKGTRGLHHIPPGAKVLMPVSIEREVWEYFSGKAGQRGVELSDLVTEVLKRDIEISEALK